MKAQDWFLVLVVGATWAACLFTCATRLLIDFYFAKRIDFLDQMEKKFDGDREELARKVFN